MRLYRLMRARFEMIESWIWGIDLLGDKLAESWLEEDRERNNIDFLQALSSKGCILHVVPIESFIKMFGPEVGPIRVNYIKICID
jgi:hypothetical protein